MAKALGPKYIKLASESLMAISILVYVRLKLQEHLSNVSTSSVATGVQTAAMLVLDVLTVATYNVSNSRLLHFWPAMTM